MSYHTSDLIKEVQTQNPTLTKTQAKAAVLATLDAINTLTENPSERLILRGFGTFERKLREARTARNPQTGQPIQVPAKATLRFRASK